MEARLSAAFAYATLHFKGKTERRRRIFCKILNQLSAQNEGFFVILHAEIQPIFSTLDMTKIRHKTIICCLLAVALTSNIIYQCVGCNSKSGGAQTEEKEDHLPRLNKLLTNELSSRPETEGMDKDIERYMKRWELRGVQIAVSRNDSLVYAKGFGWADEERGEAMTPGHIMRIASVSKLLTAVGIMKLREQGRLKLSDHVFGADGILNEHDSRQAAFRHHGGTTAAP